MTQSEILKIITPKKELIADAAILQIDCKFKHHIINLSTTRDIAFVGFNTSLDYHILQVKHLVAGTFINLPGTKNVVGNWAENDGDTTYVRCTYDGSSWIFELAVVLNVDGTGLGGDGTGVGDGDGSNDAYVLGGNSFGEPAILGTTDNQPVVMQVNNNEIMKLATSGNVLINRTVDTGERLQVDGTILAKQVNIQGSGELLSVTGGSGTPSLKVLNNGKVLLNSQCGPIDPYNLWYFYCNRGVVFAPGNQLSSQHAAGDITYASIGSDSLVDFTSNTKATLFRISFKQRSLTNSAYNTELIKLHIADSTYPDGEGSTFNNASKQVTDILAENGDVFLNTIGGVTRVGGGAKTTAPFQVNGSPQFTLQDFANDAAAAAGGVLIGQLYRTGNNVKIRIA